MPTLYSFPLASPGPSGNGVRAEIFVRKYAFTREMAPYNDGSKRPADVRIAGSRWGRGYPMLEVVRRVLSTPIGSYAPNPLFGVDDSVLTKAGPRVQERWKAAVRAALRYLTDAGRITRLKVTVDPPLGGTLLYEVAFIDPVSSEVEPLIFSSLAQAA